MSRSMSPSPLPFSSEKCTFSQGHIMLCIIEIHNTDSSDGIVCYLLIQASSACVTWWKLWKRVLGLPQQYEIAARKVQVCHLYRMAVRWVAFCGHPFHCGPWVNSVFSLIFLSNLIIFLPTCLTASELYWGYCFCFHLVTKMALRATGQR